MQQKQSEHIEMAWRPTRASRRARGLTLIELVFSLMLLTLFLGMTHKALRDVFLYPRQSLRRFSDRSEAMTVERFIVESMKSAQDGYVWSKTDESGVRVLMGLAREFRKDDEPPVTEYVLFSYQKASHTMLRWHLRPDKVEREIGELHPQREISDRKWQKLLAIEKSSVAATHLVNFVFDMGAEEDPVQLRIEVNSSPKGTDGKYLAPSREIERKLSKVRDASQ